VVEIMVDFLPLSRFSKFHFGLQTKGLESRFKSLEQGGVWQCRERKKYIYIFKKKKKKNSFG
jgi:hypothetical protein